MSAKAQYQAAWMERQQIDPGDPRHGRYSTYVNYRCRCDDCRAAARAYSRDRRAGIRPVRSAA